jgi:predicted nucleotidyltransferase
MDRLIVNDEILAIKDRIVDALPIEKLYLFGSYAYGIPNENSDYDLYMVLANDSIRPIDAIGYAYISMRGMKRKSADILAGSAETFDRRRQQQTLEQKIFNEGVLLYERER